MAEQANQRDQIEGSPRQSRDTSADKWNTTGYGDGSAIAVDFEGTDRSCESAGVRAEGDNKGAGSRRWLRPQQFTILPPALTRDHAADGGAGEPARSD